MQHGSPLFPAPVPVSSPVLLTPAQIPAESCPKRYQAGCHTPSTAAGTRRKGRSAPPGALRFPLVILSRLVSAFGVVGLDKPCGFQPLKHLVDVIVKSGHVEILNGFSRRTATIGRVGQSCDKRLADNVEPNVALRQHFEKGLPKTLIELRQRVKIITQLIRLPANLDRNVTTLLVRHRIPPSNDGGAAPWPPRLSPRQESARPWA